jgi:hypothetical protein
VRALIVGTCVLVVHLGASAGHAQQTAAPFAPGWYIVEPAAEFAVIQLASSEVLGDSASAVLAYEQAAINRGEVVLAFEQAAGTFLVFEWFGRLSAVRGNGALTRAPDGGRPAILKEEVQFLDRVLAAGSTLWVVAIDAAARTATVVLDGGRRETIPSTSVSVIMNEFRPTLGALSFRPVQ